jgi:nucleotide-binding universal stress UspA family protein
MSDVLKRILVPSDGSTESEAVLGMLLPIARQQGSEVSVLHVAEPGRAEQAPRVRLETLCAALRSAGVDARMLLREGVPADEILRWARERPADVIAMTTHGYSGLKRAIAGSLAERLLRRARVPLLTTRPDVAPRPWSRIVVALDGSPRAEAVLQDAAALGRISGAEVDLVQVALPAVRASGLGEMPMLMPMEDPRPYLDRTVRHLEALGVRARATILEGLAVPRLLKHLGEERAALACIASHGRSGLARVLMGSIAEEMLRHAPCPVWLRRSVEEPPPDGLTAEPIPAFGSG